MSLILKLNKMLSGWPDTTLSWMLAIIAGVALLVAWRGNAALKAAVAAWMLLP